MSILLVIGTNIFKVDDKWDLVTKSWDRYGIWVDPSKIFTSTEPRWTGQEEGGGWGSKVN